MLDGVKQSRKVRIYMWVELLIVYFVKADYFSGFLVCPDSADYYLNINGKTPLIVVPLPGQLESVSSPPMSCVLSCMVRSP